MFHGKTKEISDGGLVFLSTFHKVSVCRTPSRHTMVVKWRRLWLVKDIFMSLGRRSGAELVRCEARNDADATDAMFKGVCILPRAKGRV